MSRFKVGDYVKIKDYDWLRGRGRHCKIMVVINPIKVSVRFLNGKTATYNKIYLEKTSKAVNTPLWKVMNS
jgi:hypothetical protein